MPASWGELRGPPRAPPRNHKGPPGRAPKQNSCGRIVISSSSVRRAGRAIQRDVRLGQLFHYSRPSPGESFGTCERNGRKLFFRDSTLRLDSQREPHLLSHALTAPVPYFHDSCSVRCGSSLAREG